MLSLGLFVLIMFLPEKVRMNVVFFIIIFSFSVPSILPPQYWLPGNITLENLLYVYFILYSYKKGWLKKSELTVFGKIALTIGFVFFIAQPLYVALKGVLFFGDNIIKPLISISKSVLNIIIVFAFIVFGSKNPRNYSLLLRMIFYSAAIYCLTSIFQGVFIKLGYNVTTMYDVSEDIIRYEGITGLSVNPFGALIVIVLAVLFNFFLLKKIRLLPFLMLSGILIIGILLTGSRTTFISMLIIGLLFLSDKRLNLKRNTFYGYWMILVMVVFLAFRYGDTVITRFKQGNEEYGYGGLGARIQYWEMYMNDMVQNPHYFIIGNTGAPTYSRNPHNYYVLVLFQSGLVFIIILFVLIRKMIKYYKILKKNFHSLGIRDPIYTNLYFIVIPQLIYWIPGNQHIFQWTLIFLGTLYIPYFIQQGIPAQRISQPDSKLKKQQVFSNGLLI